MTPPRPIQSIALQHWLPALVAASLLLLAVTFILTDLQHARSRLEESATRMLQLINIQNAVALRRALETGDEDTLQGLVSGIALDDQVDWVALTDIDNTVRASSHYAWLERNLNRLIHNPASLPTIPRGSTLQIDADGPYMLSIKPIQYRPRQHPDDKDTAILWVHLDRSNSIQALHHELRNAALLWLAGTLGLILILTWLLRRFVTTPLTHLEAAARQIAAGDLDVRLNIHGRGDVADLAHSMQHMAQRIAQASTALRQSEQRLSITLDSIGDAVLVTDLQGLVTRMNPVAEQMTGWKTQEAQGHPVIEVFHIVNALTREPAEHPVGRVLREGVVVGLANHTTLISRDGTEYQIADSAAPIVDEDGQTLGVVMVFQDVTLRYAAEREISATKERLQAILSSLPDPCFVLDGNGTYVDILGGREELLAASREALLGRRVQDVLSPEQAAPIMRVVEETLDSGRPGHLEYEIDTPGGIRFFEGNTAPLHDADRPLVIWLARDHTERRLAEEQLQQLARFDQLTGLANRATTTEHLQALLHANRRNQHFGAVIFIDIDRFKNINDSLGHSLGDELLRLIAGKLRQAIRNEDIAARFGGDEFVVVLGDLGSERLDASAHAEDIAEKLRRLCAEPLTLDEQPLQVTISAGIVLFPDDDSDVEGLLKRADIAMYKAKEAGRNQTCFFSPELQEIAESRLTIQRELRIALKEDQLRLYVQPRVNQDGHWIGGEVLVRWQHPERGLLLPGNFIPVAETSGLVDDIDQWVIAHTIQALAEQQRASGQPLPPLSLNITADLLLNPHFPSELQHRCMEHAIAPDLLELEITERVLLQDHNHATAVIEGLRRLGVQFSIDDFGTGYSSLRYLQRLPLHTLKIDKSFVDRLPAHAGDARIVTTIIDMARHLALDVVAEGVETEAQAAFLMQQGCSKFQGFLYARPMPWQAFFEALPRHCRTPGAATD